jgi:spore coat polysaccharide biosynthesis predicted glycosyltransferase SpsG
MKAVFRVDSNLLTGFGHFSRVLNFYRTWKSIDTNLEVIFIGNYNEFAISRLNFFQISYLNILVDDFSNLYEAYFYKCDFIIFDSYFLTQKQINLISNLSSKTILIDDFCKYSFFNIDYIINFRCKAESLFLYDSRFSFLGISNLIVAPELVRFRNSRLKKTSYQFSNVTLFFGGAFEQIEKIEKVVDALLEINPFFRISLVSNLVLNKHSKINYIPTNYSIEKIFEETDFIIAGGGLIKYEAAFALIPVLAFSTNELQDEDNRFLSKENIVIDLGPLDEFSFSKFSFQFSSFFENNNQLKSQLDNNYSLFGMDPTANLIKAIINSTQH